LLGGLMLALLAAFSSAAREALFALLRRLGVLQR
jgi:hypothetical protein